MKRFFCIVLSAVISTFAFAQGITKNGMITTDGTTYINRNGAVGLSTGVDKNGKTVLASPLPTVTTTAISALTNTQATSGGNVTANGTSNVTARGITWSLTTSPNITGQGTVIIDGATTGTGVGSFNSNIAGLAYSSTYYVRAYATNSSGTVYGNEVSFTTAGPPVAQSGSIAICDYSHYTTVADIVLSNGTVWMDRNLGASRAATSLTDYEAYGCTYQWGRGNDGHASMNWTSGTTGTIVNGATTIQSTTDSPGHSDFIDQTGDWRSPKNDALWQGTAGINNPCPSGYRIPTQAELDAASNSTNFATMKFSLPGERFAGSIVNTGLLGVYHTSTVSSTKVYHWNFTSAGGRYSWDTYRGKAAAIRCIKQAVAVGDNHQGGKVAYIFVAGDLGYVAGETHGLISATEDQTVQGPGGGIEWNEGIIGTSTGLGTGSANTTAIIIGQGNSYAAGLARAYTGGGYTDWYLPSKDELNKLYLNKVAIGGFADYPYWSSSEKNGNNSLYAWAVYFDTGFLTDGFPKSNSIYVRAVRSF
jgi:hypothetical protein